MAGQMTFFMLCGILVYFSTFVHGTVSLKDVAARKYKRNRVAFVAQLTTVGTTSGSGVNIPTNKIIVFDKCPLNINGGYNTKNGKFTAPVAGVYRFTTHVCNGTKKHMIAGIMKGDTQIAVTTLYNDATTACGSLDTMVQLAKGDVVTVQSRYNSYMFSNEYRWQSFTGELLFK